MLNKENYFYRREFSNFYDEDQLLTDAVSFDKDAFLRVEGKFVRDSLSSSVPSEAGRSGAAQHWLTVG